MLQLPGYSVYAKNYEGSRTVTYRGIRLNDQRKVILKTFKSAYPALHDLASMQQEYKLAKTLSDVPGIIKIYELTKGQQSNVLIMEDIDGETLREFIDNKPLSIDVFLKIAIQLAEIIAVLHHHHIIHKDIKPSNIIINAETLAVKLTDFSISSQLSLETQEALYPTSLEGTLAYMSPEQTGRMNRPIDYRTDLYSLGVTFYEMLTGQPPFQSQDPMELIHAHLAINPIPPNALNNTVPQMLANIVMKLLAKTPEQRYASATGLKADLLDCQQQWLTNHEINMFPLGRNDLHDTLQISQKIYGRDHELNQLLSAFEHVAAGSVELIVVSGPPGVGKSVLIHEMHKPIVQQHGYFISGKFDQLQRGIPYSAVIKAFQHLVKQVLAEPENRLNMIRQELIDALGINGQVIINVIPEVELIIGKQPEVPMLPPAEAQNRFNVVFQSFVHAFARKNHPLVIFLDDMQWADAASLQLMELLLLQTDLHYCLFIQSYRDNEVDTSHPYALTLRNLQKANKNVHHITLRPLEEKWINQLLADTLGQRIDEVASLGKALMSKTDGNPFYVNEFLKTLYTEHLLTYAYEKHSWTWNIELINKLGITTNIVDLVIRKIQKLPPASEEIIKLASCLGNTFDIETLGIICGQPVPAVAGKLWDSVEMNLLTPVGNNYKQIDLLIDHTLPKEQGAEKIYYRFLHDRIQQAAYELIPEKEKQAVHLKIGRLLLNDYLRQESPSKLFDLLAHFNKSLGLLSTAQEKRQLIELNLAAGKNARASSAFEAALSYFKAGISIAGHLQWETDYELLFDLYKELSQCEYLTGAIELAEQHFDLLLEKATSNLDKVSIYQVKMQLYTNIGKHQEVLKLGMTALQLLGVHMSMQPTLFSVLKVFFYTKWKLKHADLATLDQKLFEMTDQRLLGIIRTFHHMYVSAFFTDQHLFLMMICKSILMSLKHGYSAFLTADIMGYAFVLIDKFNDFKLAIPAADFGLRLEKKYKNNLAISKANAVYSMFINHWKHHASTNLDRLQYTFNICLESGDILDAGYVKFAYEHILYLLGKPLEETHREGLKALEFLKKNKDPGFYEYLSMHLHAIRYLQADPNAKMADFLPFLERIKQSDYKLLWRYGYSLLSFLYYINGDYANALNMSATSDLYKEFSKSTVGNVDSYTIYGLCITAAYALADRKTQRQHLQTLRRIHKKMKIWAQQSPANFGHKFVLISAEIARIKGKENEAAGLYDHAITLAKEHDYTQYIALANECAARFYLALGKPRFAKTYLQDAHYAYLRWGATYKARLLEKNYSELLKESVLPRSKLDHSHNSIDSSTALGTSLDVISALKATQALSEEIRLERLLENLLHIVVENAGAERVLLITQRNQKLFVEGESELTGQKLYLLNPAPVESREDLPLTVLNYVQRSRESVVLNDASHDEQFSQDICIIQRQPKSVLCMPIIHHNEFIGCLYLENNLTTNAFTQDRLVVLKLLASQAAISLENARLYSATERFVPHELLAQLNKHNLAEMQLGDQIQRIMSIMFCDIRRFTEISEKLSPAEAFQFINNFFGYMEPVIKHHQGFIDKYIGDAIMALFEHDADTAVYAANALRERLIVFNQQRQSTGKLPIEMGIGINTGELILGIIGGEHRMEGSVIGDSVNIAARIEGVTKTYGVHVLISGMTKAQLQFPDKFALRLIDKVTVKGKSLPVDLWEVFDADPAPFKEKKFSTLEKFRLAQENYQQGQLEEAYKLFSECAKQNPEDTVVQFYLKKISYSRRKKPLTEKTDGL